MPEKFIQRTDQQNKALHKYYDMLAEALNDSGQEVGRIIEIDIPWTALLVKELIWRPIQIAVLGKVSTTDLGNNEITQIWEIIHRSVAQKKGIDIPFPSIEVDKRQQQLF